MRPGGRPGHPGTTRPVGEPTKRITIRVAACVCGGTDRRGVEQAPVERRQVVDLPPITPESVEAVVHRVTCPGCGQVQTAPFPAAFSAPVRLGSGVQALATYVHEVHHVAYARLGTLRDEVFGLSVSPGTLVALVQRTARLSSPAPRGLWRESHREEQERRWIRRRRPSGSWRSGMRTGARGPC